MRTTKLRAVGADTTQVNGREQIFSELDRRAADENLDGQAVADRLGYTVSYIAKLRKGTARLEASPGFLRAVADFLGVPPLEVFLLAGFVDAADFGPPASFAQYLDIHYAAMVKDPLVASMMPNIRDWGLTPLAGKLCIVGLYQVQFRLAESLAAQREEGALINVKAMRAAIDEVLSKIQKTPESKKLSSIRVMRKKL